MRYSQRTVWAGLFVVVAIASALVWNRATPVRGNADGDAAAPAAGGAGAGALEFEALDEGPGNVSVIAHLQAGSLASSFPIWPNKPGVPVREAAPWRYLPPLVPQFD